MLAAEFSIRLEVVLYACELFVLFKKVKSSSRTLANDEEYEFEEDTEFENPFLNHTRPVFCLPNMSQDKMKPSQSYITPELLRVGLCNFFLGLLTEKKIPNATIIAPEHAIYWQYIDIILIVCGLYWSQ